MPKHSQHYEHVNYPTLLAHVARSLRPEAPPRIC
jgi:hypothetical protein